MSAIAAALINGVGSLLGNFQDTYLTNKQFDQQRQLLAEQREWDLEMWNRTNEYNSPASQMERYEAAGLNPNLMYDQGGPGLAGNIQTSAGQAPSYKQTPNIGDTSAFINMFRSIKDSEMIQSNIDLNNELSFKAAEERNQIVANTERTALENMKTTMGLSAYLSELKRNEKLSTVEISRLDALLGDVMKLQENELSKLNSSTAEFKLAANEYQKRSEQVDVLGMPAQNELTSLLVNVIKNPDKIGDQFNDVMKKYSGTFFGQFLRSLGEKLGLFQRPLKLE